MSRASQDDQLQRIEDCIARNVIETDEFQRLNGIHQLGLIRKIFPSIKHTRFEHSLGVYWETHTLLETLEKNSNISIDEFHKRCVKLAGLLHDVGHGPYSHFWEEIIEHSNVQSHFRHEDVSAEVVNEIFKKVKLSNNSEDHDYGVKLIKALIIGSKEDVHLRNADMEFIFDIVNNKSSRIDVDRLDYLIRDWNNCNPEITIPGVDVDKKLKNVRALFNNARVSADRKCVQFSISHIENINSMFELRECFHANIYQQFEVRILEDILLEMMKLRKQEDIPSFLVFQNSTSYVKENYCQNSLKEEDFERWLNAGNVPKLQKLSRAFNDFHKYVETEEKPKNGYKPIKIEYKYELPESIKNCLYAETSDHLSMNNLKMEYDFKKVLYYRIKEV